MTASDAPWDCLSCGAHAQQKPFCEHCGAARPVEGEDSALSLMLGLVCEVCDGYNDPGVPLCASCGAPLGGSGAPADLPSDVPTELAVAPVIGTPVEAPRAPTAPHAEPPSWMTPPTGQPLGTQFAMKKVDLAAVATGAEGAGIVAPKATPMPSPAAVVPTGPSHTPMATPVVVPACVRCGSPLQPGDKFCRNCGTRAGDAPALMTTQIAAVKMPSPTLPSPMLPQGATMIMPMMRAAQAPSQDAPAAPGGPSATMMFGAVTAERSAKLILVRGQSQFGSQWRLQAGETIIGRSEGMVLFPDDDALAARHCRLVFHGAELTLEPEDTVNGVFVRVRVPTPIGPGDEVVVGAERLRVLGDTDRPQLVRPDPSTPTLGSLVRPQPPIALLRIARDPAYNEVYFRTQRLLTIGRNNCDLNFPRDSFVSERHAQIAHDGQGLVLEDLRSRNGTYVRLRAPLKLAHGDLVLLGDKVLRVELPR